MPFGQATVTLAMCVKFSKLVLGAGLVRSNQEQHPFVRSGGPSLRPDLALWQSAGRSGSQGWRREGVGTGGAGAQRP